MFMKKLFSESVYFASANVATIVRIIGIFILVTAVITPFFGRFDLDDYSRSGPYLIYLSVFSGVHTFLMCRLIKFMASVVSGGGYDLSVSLTMWLRLFVVYLLYSGAVIVGSFALIIPGIYLAARYGFAEFEVVLNGKSPFASMADSWRQTKNKGITIKLMLATVMIAGGQLLINIPINYIGELSETLDVIARMMSELISSVAMLFMSIVFFRVYVLGSEQD